MTHSPGTQEAVIEKAERVLQPFLDSTLTPASRHRAALDVLAALEGGAVMSILRGNEITESPHQDAPMFSFDSLDDGRCIVHLVDYRILPKAQYHDELKETAEEMREACCAEIEAWLMRADSVTTLLDAIRALGVEG